MVIREGEGRCYHW